MTSVTPPSVYNGRYELTRQIARGGMAEVYLAQDLLLDRPVALKVLFPELSVDRNFVERFRREAQAAANLSHPNIVSVYDWGESDQTYFIVMEYVDGRPLSALLRAEGPLLADRAAAIGAEVASALAFAHAHGVIHRDVKPGNILITNDGDVKVTDFGIARAANNADNLTQTGAVMGTATYFSPEQAQGHRVDARSDVYALGVVLYEMVTGGPPFTADSPISVAYQHVRETPRPPSQIEPGLAPAFEAIVLQAMAKVPERRYQSAQDLRADLLRFQQGRGVVAVPPADAGVTALQTAVADKTRVVPAAAAEEERDRRTRRYVILLFVLLAALALVLYLVGRNLGVFGSSATSFAVPNVVGQSLSQASQTLTTDGLKVSVSRQANAASVNTVFAQSPSAPTKVSRGDTVTLDVSTGPGKVSVPNVQGQSLATATNTLQAAGLTVTTQQVQDSQVPPNTVVSQSPSAGTSVDKGSVVTLTVASGPGQVRVPSVVGLTESQATNLLSQNGLQVGNISNQPSTSVPQGQVISSNPSPGTRVDQGSSVSLVVSSGPPQVQVPGVVGFTQSAAQAAITSAGLTPNVVFQSVTNPAQVGIVLSQSPGSGTTVNPGSTVTITVGQSAGKSGSASPQAAHDHPG